MNPTITVDVDISNPGQVFACCGLLELAHRLTPLYNRAKGWFEDINRIQTKFQIEGYDEKNEPISLQTIMEKLNHTEITELEYNDKEGPILLGEPFNIIIDWRKPYPQNDSVKTWAGKQEIFPILKELLKLLPYDIKPDMSILTYNRMTNISVTSFDVSKSENKIDVGFSLDDLNLYSPSIFVVTELFALIGLQRFNPEKSIERYQRFYHVWDKPLYANNASIAIFSSIIGIQSKIFTFNLYRRDSGGRYKSFSNAKLIL